MKRILILENIPETRQWLIRITAEAFPSSTVEQAGCIADVTDDLIRENSFDLALIDLCLPDGLGLECLRKLRTLSPTTICVVITVLSDDAHVVAALAAGADGYLLKDQTVEQISIQLADLSHGLPAISPSIARRIVHHFSLTGPTEKDDDSLTSREREILTMISRGHRNCDVAVSLCISANTVATHVKSIYKKLSISSRAEASWQASRLGL